MPARPTGGGPATEEVAGGRESFPLRERGPTFCSRARRPGTAPNFRLRATEVTGLRRAAAPSAEPGSQGAALCPRRRPGELHGVSAGLRAEGAGAGAHCFLSSRALRALRLVRWASRSPPPPPSGRARAQLAAEGVEEDDPHLPLRFSSSRAAPLRWTVKQSLGTGQQRSWWVVLPLSLSLMGLVIWCFFRKETSADRWLRRMLLEEVPEPSYTSEEPGAPVAHGART